MRVVSSQYLPSISQEDKGQIVVEIDYDVPNEVSSHMFEIQEAIKSFKLILRNQELPNKGKPTFVPPRWSRDAKLAYVPDIRAQKYFFIISKDQLVRPVIKTLENLFKTTIKSEKQKPE